MKLFVGHMPLARMLLLVHVTAVKSVFAISPSALPAHTPPAIAAALTGGSARSGSVHSTYLPWLNKTIHQVKGTELRSQRPFQWAWDEAGNVLQDGGAALELAERRARRADMGALSEDLWQAFGAVAPGGVYPVLVWLPVVEPVVDKATLIADPTAMGEARRSSRARSAAARQRVFGEAPWLAAIARPISGAPCVRAELTEPQTIALPLCQHDLRHGSSESLA
jgi:hypothetical protein